MEIQPDFSDLLKLVNAHSVDYLVVGGYALAFHGAPHYTGDMALFVKPDEINARNIIEALNKFGFNAEGFSLSDFSKPEKVIQLGAPPVRIDIVTSLSGVSWEEAFSGRIEGKYGDTTVYYIGRDQFILNKSSTGRKRDLADLEALGEK
jgi:hypothetical protein